jgi:hypothetical protein
LCATGSGQSLVALADESSDLAPLVGEEGGVASAAAKGSREQDHGGQRNGHADADALAPKPRSMRWIGLIRGVGARSRNPRAGPVAICGFWF